MRGGGRRRNLTSGSSSTSGPNKKLECCRVYKRRPKKENENRDIISNLPDHILHHIFTFLDIKQAIQTCLLSRRWRYFWVSVPTLKFSYMQGKGCRSKTNRNEYMAFVDRVLMFRGNSNIHGFVLVTDKDCIDITDRLNTWILVCVIRNAQELTLDTYFPGIFHFHHCLFTCKSLTKLVLDSYSGHVSLSLPDSITLPRLKLLSLKSVKLEDECIMNQIFSSCPVLESLIMKHCEFPHFNINISSPKLQHLVLQNCTTRSNVYLDPVDIKFNLCAPNLISFYCDNAMSQYCAPKNLCSLVKADIYVCVSPDLSKEKKAMYAQCMVNILKELQHVEDLKLSASFLEVVTGAPYLLDSQPAEFCNLRCLKVKGTWRSIDNIHAISYLLKISPNIETLSVEVCCIECDKFGNAATDLLDMQPTQFCNLRYLKMDDALLSIDSIYVIAYFLMLSPKIETFSFKVSYSSSVRHPFWDPDEINSNSANRGDFWEAGLSLESLLNHLKCFELRDVRGLINELEFIEILLKNAMLLEKLLIVFDISYTTKRELVQRRLVKFREKVLTFPKTSSSVVIMFKSNN